MARAGNDPTPPIVVSGVMAGDTVRILDGSTVRATKTVPTPPVPESASVTFNATAASSEVTLAGDGPYTFTAEAVDAAGTSRPRPQASCTPSRPALPPHRRSRR